MEKAEEEEEKPTVVVKKKKELAIGAIGAGVTAGAAIAYSIARPQYYRSGIAKQKEKLMEMEMQYHDLVKKDEEIADRVEEAITTFARACDNLAMTKEDLGRVENATMQDYTPTSHRRIEESKLVIEEEEEEKEPGESGAHIVKPPVDFSEPAYKSDMPEVFDSLSDSLAQTTQAPHQKIDLKHAIKAD